MLTPTVANRLSWLYAVGNTPATSLTRSIPHGQDADILTLGCGDLRNVLFTAYVERGLVPRKLDITCCDYDERIIGRNIILLTLILDDDAKVTEGSLWDIYYHLYLDDSTAQLILQQTEKILPLLKSVEAWRDGPYGRTLKFCDRDTLDDVRRICRLVMRGSQNRGNKAFKDAFIRHSKASTDSRARQLGNGSNLAAMRSAAPLSMSAVDELVRAGNQYWNEGTVTARKIADPVPNPMFAALVSEHGILHYGTDPILGYHLATAFAPLSPHSPLELKDPVPAFRAGAAAMAQFREWIAAFRLAVKRGIVLRFAVAEALALCHTLQHVSASGSSSANWYRRQFELKLLALDETAYGSGREGPAAFDMVDTSNLSDHLGTLNVVIATAPLMKQKPWATVYTELMIKRHDSQQRAFDSLLCGHAPTVSLLLGVSPVQYWTNAKCESHVVEVFLGLMTKESSTGKETQLHSRLAWKRDDQFSGQFGGRGRLHIEAQTLCRLLFQIYLDMFQWESYRAGLAAASPFSRSATYSHYHRGSFATLLQLVKSRVKTDWSQVCSGLLDSIAQDRTIALSSNQVQELGVQMHLLGVSTEPWLLNEVKTQPDAGPLKGWRDIPPAVAVTFVVPREAFVRLYDLSQKNKLASPTLVGSLRASPAATNQWHNIYSVVHITFGNVKSNAGEDAAVVMEQDELGWEGSSPLIASFVVPTASLQGTMLYGPILGMSMSVFETRLGDEKRVFVSRLMPGQSAHRVACGGVTPFEDAAGEESKDQRVKISAEVPASESRISTVTGHVDISSGRGKSLLRDKAPIELRQQDPFVIEVVFGRDELVCPLRFPVPVTKADSKTRIARTTGYVEVIAPLADPVVSDSLADFIYPTRLSPAGLPVTLNTPHVNLVNLPVLNMDDKAAMRWLNTQTSLQFSAREMQLRKVTDAKSGISENPRVNFKESIFTMFMLVSGLQGGQTGLFAINHPERGGVHMLILVSAMRLDGDAASVVLDAAVIPLTMELITSERFKSFLIIIQSLECCMLNVNDAELILWKRALPSLVERCRTWGHVQKCEYRRKGATVPLSIEPGKQVVCSCGNGKLPKDFVSLPEWDAAAPNAVRVAISPTYAVPFVEDAVDSSFADMMDGAAPQTTISERCHGCGRGEGGAQAVTLKKCTRCMRAKYCSEECQKKDWKKHRTECKRGN
ncbi:MYND finger domain-containing protein [Hirsutella rhossiliensis]|uniref:MYND finger domain-containing protein n=1 Tax=Hirsutella rhossiliensis TaxID=111463 RepID=A0A9P8MP39_9HYPO|nr:MYND finger domain-containing protein [Hirsutella rhossiliensis]KAH0959743.1 MYND finger domain-containing protein [Hirsutella rhossiliensis]